MNKKIIGILVVTLFFASVYGGATKTNLTDHNFVDETSVLIDPPGEWTRIYGDAGRYDEGFFMDQTNDDGFILTIYSYPYLWLIKTDADGNKIWDKKFGESDELSSGWGVKQTKDNGFIIVGRTKGTWSSSHGGYWDYDAWVIKTDENGNEKWSMTYGGIFDDRGYSILELEDGGYVFTGQKNGIKDETGELWLVKISDNGDIIWEKIYNPSSHQERGYRICHTVDGGYIIGALRDNYIDFDTGEEISCDFWLVKTDSEGNMIWDKTFGGPNSYDWCWSVDTTNDNGYMMVGSTTQYGENSETLVVKTDGNGNKLWDKKYRALNTTYSRGYYSINTIDGDFLISAYYDTCAALIKINGEGEKIWVRNFETLNTIRCCMQLDDESYVFTGITSDADGYISKAINTPPLKPDTPSGEINGKAGTEYIYSTTATDLDSDQLYYWFDWGDGANSSWIGPYDSEEYVEASHTWTSQGSYEVKVKTKDVYDLESLWSESLPISMPKNKAINTPFLQFLEKHQHMFPLLRQLLEL